MKTAGALRLSVLIVSSLFAGSAFAQSWTDAQAAAWKVSADTWERDLKQDSGWIEDATHAAVTGWGSDYPAPRNRASLLRWADHGKTVSKMTMYDLSPLAITVTEHAAVVHYYYTTASKAALDGKVETVHGRCTDTLVRDGGQWKFLGWSCSDEPKRS